MKIYTKRGDRGETSLIGGQRVPKYDDRVEAYGTIDELNSYLGLIHDLSDEDNIKNNLLRIQNILFIAESRVAADSVQALSQLPELQEEEIHFLEQEIDRISNTLPALKNFVLPSGHYLASHTHISRTICRRAERITLKASVQQDIDANVLIYLNRLSDFLFILARYFANKLGKGDILWQSKNKVK